MARTIIMGATPVALLLGPPFTRCVAAVRARDIPLCEWRIAEGAERERVFLRDTEGNHCVC